MTYDNAVADCQAQGRELAYPSNAEENIAIWNAHPETRNIWLGININDGQSWKTVGGDAQEYFAWDSGQPDSGGSGWSEPCVEMWDRGNGDGLWNDLTCNHERHFLCQEPRKFFWRRLYAQSEFDLLIVNLFKI